MSVITLSFMQRFMGNLNTAIKTFVEEKLTPITETMGGAISDLMIRAGESIETGADVNDMTIKGVFYIASDSDASEIAHLPVEKSGKFIVAETGSGVVQIFIINEDSSLYMRNYSSDWNAWVGYASSDKLLPLAEGADGEYVLTATISNGTPVYSWEAKTGE